MTLTYIREYQEDGGIYSEPGAEPGAPLNSLLDAHAPPLRVVLEIGAALGDILAIAHEDGKTHGDPKIGMVRIDAKGNVALTDFKPGRRTTRAPEPTPIHPASSVYSLGVVLHSLMCEQSFGRVPKSEAEHDEAIVQKVIEYDFNLAEGHNWIGELKEFLCSMMAFSPASRPSPDEVADVLGNAADSLEGSALDDWAKMACSSSTQARAKLRQAPKEELEGVRTVHELDDDPETELSAPTLVEKALQENFAGPGITLLDESLDETILDQAHSTLQSDGFAFEETIIDELPLEAIRSETVSIHEQETVIGENLLQRAVETTPAPAARPATPPPPPTPEPPRPPPAATPQPPPNQPAQGVIKGPTLPPPPPPSSSTRSPKGNPAKNVLIGLVIVVALGGGAYLGLTKSNDSGSEQSTKLPGPITQPEAIPEEVPEIPEQIAEVPVSTASSPDTPAPETAPAPVATTPVPVPVAAPTPEPAPVAAPAPVATTPAPAAAPPPPTRPTPAPVATPAAPPPVPEPTVATAPPYRTRITIQGNSAAITCGDGQRPEVNGPLSLTFQSSQYCRVEIDGAMGILNVSASGTYTCSKAGAQVTCAQTR